MATINKINRESDPFTIDPGASGDAYIQFNINGTGEFRIGVDDDASDAFKISQGSALGTNDTFVMTADGIMTLPLNPAFINEQNTESSVTGDGTVHSYGSVTATTSVVDRNSDMTEGNGAGTPATFTAPLTGLYYLQWRMNANGNPVPSWIGYITTSNRTYRFINSPGRQASFNFFGQTGFLCFSGGVIADMDASDTAIWYYVGSSGTKNSSLNGVTLSGYLIG